MSWLSAALGIDRRDRNRQLQEWQGAGPEKRFRDATIQEGNRMNQRENQYQTSRGGYMDLLQNGQQAFNDSARAAVAAAMPAFNSQLNGIRESSIRRGVQNGELGTSYEGDLASALSKNLDNSIAGQALGLYNSRLQGYGNLTGMDLGAEEASTNRYLDANASELDRKDAARDRKQRSQLGWANLGGSILSHFLPGGGGGGGLG